MRRNLNQSAAGRRILGTPQVGVLASAIPSTGDQGASLLYNKIQAGDPAGCLYRIWITSQPASGTLVVDETGAFTFSGAADGTWTAGERIDKYDPAVGLFSTDTGTAQFNVNVAGAALAGAAAAVATASAALAGSAAALSGSGAAVASATGALTTAIRLSGTATATAAAAATLKVNGAALGGLASAQATASGTLNAGPIVPVTFPAASVPAAHRVVFAGGTKVVTFDGGTKTVRF
jgi:hypothetical protein